MNTTTDEIDERELLSVLNNRLAACDSHSESDIGESRDKGYKYYYGQPMGNERKGRSQHVSMDVFDAVEATKSMLMETFSADKKVCKFEAQTPEDVVGAKMATALTNYIFYRANKGTKIIQDVIHDALIAKTGTVKRYYKEDFAYEEEEFTDISENEFLLLAADPMVTVTNMEEREISVEIQDPQTGQMTSTFQKTITGEIARKIDKSKICIEVIPPEDFLVTARATNEEDADFASHRTTRTRGELLEEGFDPDVVDRLDEEKHLHSDGSSGRNSIDNYSSSNSADEDHDRMYVTIYESYLKKYRQDLKTCVFLKVLHSRTVLLDVEIVSEMPFRYFTPYPCSHKFHGMSMADVLFDIQKTQSSLKRGVVDHTFMTNTSRFVANLALVKNPRDLLNNSVGAVIDVSSPNPESVVKPMPVPNLSGTVFQAIENLEVEKEARSGMSRMARGMDSTVVSKQNSSDLITQFMNASNRRVMMMARNFSENFLKPLLEDVYRLAVQYEKKEKLLQLDGQFVAVNAAFLGDRTEMSIAVALTPEEQQKEAQMLLSMDQSFAMNPSDPTASGLYGPVQRHALLTRAFDLMGIKDAANYLFDPSSEQAMQQQQASQEQQAEAAARADEVEKFNAGMLARQVAVQEATLELEVVKEQNRMLLETETMQHTQEETESRLLLDSTKQIHDIEMSQEELKLEKTQSRNVSINT